MEILLEYEVSLFYEAIQKLKNELDGLEYFPVGCCQLASYTFGFYLLQKKIVEAKDLFLFRSINHSDGSKRSGHIWLQMNQIIIDLTSGQFPDAPSKFMATKDNKFHSTFVNVSSEQFEIAYSKLSSRYENQVIQLNEVISKQIIEMTSQRELN